VTISFSYFLSIFYSRRLLFAPRFLREVQNTKKRVSELLYRCCRCCCGEKYFTVSRRLLRFVILFKKKKQKKKKVTKHLLLGPYFLVAQSMVNSRSAATWRISRTVNKLPLICVRLGEPKIVAMVSRSVFPARLCTAVYNILPLLVVNLFFKQSANRRRKKGAPPKNNNK